MSGFVYLIALALDSRSKRVPVKAGATFYLFCSYFASLGKFAAAIMQGNHVSHVMPAPADGDAKKRLFVLQLRAYRTLRPLPPLLIDGIAFSQRLFV